MYRNVDDLGRIVLPSEMRKQLNIKGGDAVNIDIRNDKIVITNKNTFDIEQYLKDEVLPTLIGDDEMTKGARAMCGLILDKLKD